MPETAGTVRCPSCGAPAEPESTACPYCGTLLALVACPSCFAKLFRGTRFCAHCGAEAVREEAKPRPSRPCPECRRPLEPVKVGKVTLDECTRCGGLWVDTTSFHRVCEETERQAAILSAAFSRAEPKGTPAAPQGYLPCPECRRLMNRQNFARVSGVLVDVCKGHGVWFNQGELRRIVEFIRAGGMARARAREKEDLRDERARLRQAELDAHRAAARLSAGYREGPVGDDVEILSAVRGLIDWLI
jgi:Zn-finger nucleic acid-binding protein